MIGGSDMEQVMVLCMCGFSASSPLLPHLLSHAKMLYSMVAGPFPYRSSLSANAINFGISSMHNFDGVSIHQPSQIDWSASFVKHNGNVHNNKALSWVE